MPQNALVNFARKPVDLSIRLGAGKYEGLQSEYLMEDHLYPVCHPLYLKEHAITSLDDIANVRLIEDTRAGMNWDCWLTITNKNIKTTVPTLKYEGAHVVIEGSLTVQGVALVRHSLAWKYIEQGLLVKVSDIEVC
jgi:DNA-binding transcriptional LysR family regulator